MTVVIDTSILVAWANTGDSKHVEASGLMKRIIAGEYGLPVTSDYVLDEGLTLLQKRVGNPKSAVEFASYFLGDDAGRAPVEMRMLDLEGLRDALKLHLERYGRRLSFTDCVLALMARRLGGPVASFDRGFDGIVPRIEA